MIMPRDFRPGAEPSAHALGHPTAGQQQADARLAVVGSVADSALATWAELWEEFKPGVTPGGMVLPDMQHGFTPACGWSEFLEKFWLMKHYLEHVSRYCRERPPG